MQSQEEVVKLLVTRNDFSEGKIKGAVDWFFQRLGMPVQYFANHSNEDISQHIQSLMVRSLESPSPLLPSFRIAFVLCWRIVCIYEIGAVCELRTRLERCAALCMTISVPTLAARLCLASNTFLQRQSLSFLTASAGRQGARRELKPPVRHQPPPGEGGEQGAPIIPRCPVFQLSQSSSQK
jgi:hypothetical protein